VHANPFRKPCVLRWWELITLDAIASGKTRVNFGNTIGDVDERRLGVTGGGVKVRDNPCGAPSTAAW
jgi:hypothetical protein